MFVNDFIQPYPVLSGIVGETLEQGSHKAVMWGEDGLIYLATAPEKAVGVLLSTTPDSCEKGATVSFLVRQVGLLEVAESVLAGDFLTINEQGQGVKAKAGDVIFGRAFTSGETGTFVQTNITPYGATLGG